MIMVLRVLSIFEGEELTWKEMKSEEHPNVIQNTSCSVSFPSERLSGATDIFAAFTEQFLWILSRFWSAILAF